jgi:gluconate 2-dehydrogenase gamma chain
MLLAVFQGHTMTSHDQSRRIFLQQSAGVAGTTWAGAVLPGLVAISQAACTAKEEALVFSILRADEAIEFEAVAARIIPTTDTPGAREAGVIYFFDQSFGTFNAPMLPTLRGGLAEMQTGIDGGRKFSDLSEDEQDALLAANADTPFFGLIRMMTFTGFFGMSEYGGNKDGVGWKLLGMDPHAHAYTYPFGYYDAEFVKENSDA